MICLAYRVRAEVGKAPLRGCLVFFWSSSLAIVGREFRNVRANKHYGKAAIWFENCLALRIGTKIIGLLAVLLSRDGNECPRPHKILGRLRDRLLSGQKNCENQR